MQIGIIGSSIWQQNLLLMECLTIDESSRNETIARLKRELGLGELLYLATCNRVEFIYVASDNDPRLLYRLIDFFFSGRRDINFFPNDFYHYTRREAVLHLFRTASALESLVVGETQIAGQLKQAYENSETAGICGPVLKELVGEALQVARKIKRETSLGEGALSMASLAFVALQEQLTNQTDAVTALVGAGPMTRKMAVQIKQTGLSNLLFVNRTLDKAQRLAEEFGGEAMPLEAFLVNPPAMAGIISSTSATEPVFDSGFLSKLPSTTQKLVCVDLAVPRDFSHDFAHDERVTLIDIPTLKSKSQKNLRQKFIETNQANQIVREAVAGYFAYRLGVSIKPIFQNSYEESMQLAQRALDDLFARKLTNLGTDERQAVMNLVAKLVGHSAFQPAKLLSERLANLQPEFIPTELHNPSGEAM